MPNQAVGDNAMIQVSTASGTTNFINLGVIESIEGNKITSPEVATQKLSDAAWTGQPGTPDFGMVKTVLRFNASMNAVISGYQTNKTMLWVRVVPADISAVNMTANSYEVCQAFVKEFDPFGKLELNKEIVSTVDFKLSGAGTLTNAGA